MENIQKDIVYLFGKDILKRNRAGKEDAIYLKKKILMKIITCGSRHSDQQIPAYPS